MTALLFSLALSLSFVIIANISGKYKSAVKHALLVSLPLAIIGPSSTLWLINDITENVDSQTCLFADDCLIYSHPFFRTFFKGSN